MIGPSKQLSVEDAERLLARDARDLQRAVSDLVRLYQFRDRRAICYYNLSVTQCYALSAVVTHESLTQNDLAAELYLDKSTASRVVDALVSKGYILRVTDPNDGRVRNLEATKRGNGLHARIEQDLIAEARDIIDDRDPATRRATIDLVTRLARAAGARFASLNSDRAHEL